MGKTCAVITCSKQQKDGVSLISTGRKKNHLKWMQFLAYANAEFMWKPDGVKEVYVCSDHFNLAMFRANGGRLVPDGYPSLHNGIDVFVPNNDDNLESQFEIESEAVVTLNVQEKVVNCLENEQVDNNSTELADMKRALMEAEEKNVHLEKELSSLRKELSNFKEKIRILKQKCHRRKAAKRKIKEELNLHKPKRSRIGIANSDQPTTILDELKSRETMPKNAPYSDAIRDFAFRVHYYSTRAYEEVRSAVKVLPHPNSLYQWSSHIKPTPGFIQPSLEFLAKLNAESENELYFAMSCDEVYTKKDILYDGDEFVGFTDYGGIIENDQSDREATTALFIMVTSINGKYKIPIAYLLTNGLKADQLAAVLQESLNMMHKTKSKVISITFDGLSTNLSAAKALGANFEVTKDEFSPYILHPSTQEKVYFVLDPSHMIKLVRNIWFKSKILYSGDESKEIKWSYVENLYNLQKSCGLKVANKLSTRHVSFQNQKMKTKLAVQTLSNSVSVALDVCRELNMEEFRDSEATVEFLNVINSLFDVLNSKSRGKYGKAPLRSSNEKQWRSTFAKAKDYLLSLHVKYKGELVPLLATPMKTAIQGLLITIYSVEQIMDTIVLNPTTDLHYLPVFKLSQDQIETFFSVLRSRFGFNNNPNALQLRQALRAILCMNTRSINTGNCSSPEEMYTKVSPLGKINSILSDGTDPLYEDTESDENRCESLFPVGLSPIMANVVAYIAGFVGKELCRTVSCAKCICKLGMTEEDVPKIANDCVLILNRDNGGLFYPSNALISVCKVAEQVIRNEESKGLRKISKDSTVKSIVHACLEREFVKELECGTITDLHQPCQHSMNLLQKIAKKYSTVRYFHIGKEKAESINPSNIRSKCTKGTLFNGN